MITKEKLLERNHCLTVGDLRKLLMDESIPDNAPVLSERVHDMYFETHNWDTFPKKGLAWGQMMDHNDKVDNGYYRDKENFPISYPEHERKYTEDDLISAMEQFIPAHCCTVDKDDNIVFIHLHY